MVRSPTGPGVWIQRTMHRVFRAVAITVLITVPALAEVQPPEFGPGTLSFIDDDTVELRYKWHDEILAPASFVQTLAAVSIAAGTPPNPLNPWFVETALHALGVPHKDYESCWPDQGAIMVVPTAPVGAVDAALGAAGAYFDPAHQHFHYANFEMGALWRATGGGRRLGTRPIATSHKDGFCLEDLGSYGGGRRARFAGREARWRLERSRR